MIARVMRASTEMEICLFFCRCRNGDALWRVVANKKSLLILNSVLKIRASFVSGDARSGMAKGSVHNCIFLPANRLLSRLSLAGLVPIKTDGNLHRHSDERKCPMKTRRLPMLAKSRKYLIEPPCLLPPMTTTNLLWSGKLVRTRPTSLGLQGGVAQ